MMVRVKIMLGLLLVTLGICGFCAPQGYHLAKELRAHRLVNQAQDLAGEQRLPEAFARAAAAYQLAPWDPPTIRLVAEFYTAAGQEQAVFFWEKLLSSGAATTQDRRKYILFCLQRGHLALATREAQFLYRNESRTLPNLLAVAEVWARTDKTDRALELMREAALIPTQYPDEMVWRSRMMLDAPDPGLRSAARGDLWKVARAPSRAAPGALRLLAGLSDLTASEMGEIARELRRPSGAPEEDRFLALELDLRRDPAGAKDLLEKIKVQARQDGAEKKLETSRWFNRLQAYDQVLDLVTPEEALSRRDFLLVRLDALAGEKRWEEIKTLLGRDSIPLEPVFVELFLARADQELDDFPAAGVHWNRVYALAGGDRVILGYAADYALKTGTNEQAIRFYRRLTTYPQAARIAYVHLIQLLEADGNTGELRNVLQDMVRDFPEELAPHNDLLYLNLLTNQDVEASVAAACDLHEKNQDVLAERITLALGDLRLGRVVEAAALFTDVTINWSTAWPGAQAVYAAVLGASGQGDRARRVIQKIDADRLKPEEKMLIKPYE